MADSQIGSERQQKRTCVPYGQKIHPKPLPRSCCLLMIKTQHSAQSLAALNRSVAVDARRPRKQQHVTLTLMIALSSNRQEASTWASCGSPAIQLGMS